MKKTVSIFMMMIAISAIAFLSFSFHSQADPWEVPAKYKSMKNASTGDEAVKTGRMMYSKHCSSCHGKTGLGDGTKARGLDTHPGDFSSSEFQGQTDGELFYKSSFGRNEMPKFQNKIPDEDIWSIVSYMRTFKK